MAFDLEILETLLHQEEGPALDFKEEQYRFDNADVGYKAELLKDILTFANSWRLTTAYILLGVREVKAGRSEIIGVKKHLDDANLHQFVNSKTQRPIVFSYLPVRTEGVEIGVIEIPIQERPIYLAGRFGQLRENDVWIRDSSSSRVATSDEVANMGIARALAGPPEFTLEWADINRRVILPSSLTVLSQFLDPVLPPETFTPPEARGLGANIIYNSDYSQDLIKCVAERRLLVPVGFRLQNQSGIVGKRIRFTGHLRKSTGILVQDGVEDFPSRNSSLMSPRIPYLPLANHGAGDIVLREFRDRWEIDIDFGDVRPRDEIWTSDSLFLGSINPSQATLQGELKGDNISDPIKCTLEIAIEVESRAMTRNDAAPYLR